ncbi:MAG: SH3 domain-containing protein [Sedimentisphaerales bacterium]|nr:SH3 domain-containing protein [Sedimentisphaerales bacterium]
MKVKIFAMLLVLCAGITFAASMSVQVKTSKLRATPSQLGRIVSTVNYGDTVQVESSQRGWYAVTTADGKKGWLHESVLSDKPIAMRAGTTDAATGVSTDEVALAGKGFNEQVEAKMKAEKSLDFTWVDRMIAFDVSEDQILAFRSQGNLPGGEQ